MFIEARSGNSSFFGGIGFSLLRSSLADFFCGVLTRSHKKEGGKSEAGSLLFPALFITAPMGAIGASSKRMETCPTGK